MVTAPRAFLGRRYRRVVRFIAGGNNAAARSIEKASAVNARLIFRHYWNARDYQQAG
jgi:hypothetical protein